MRTGATVLGIIGGVIGLFVAGIAIIAGAASTDHNVASGFLLLLLSVAGIVGAALSQAKPMGAAITMGVAGVGGFVLVTGWWIVAGPLLIAGAVMAYMSRPVATGASVSAQAPITSGSTAPTAR